MDPVTAFGLASSVVQFLTFASSLVSKTREIQRSSHGSLVANEELAAIGRTLESQNRRIASKLGSLGPSSETGRQIIQLCGSAREVSRELIAVVEGLKGRNPSGKWDSFRQALKSVLKEQEISDILERLERYRQQIDSLLLTNIQERLQKFTETSDNKDASIEHNFNRIMESLQQGSQWQAKLVETARRGLRDDVAPEVVYQDFSSSLSTAVQHERDEYYKRRLLRSLAFPELKERYEGISAAHRRTFDWIFNEDELQGARGSDTFSTWLMSNNPLYWITGKPGSGKSTLMKYLSVDQRLKHHLKVWRGDKPVYISRFFFWNSGSALQMSKVGLMRSLLYQTLSDCPDMLSCTFTDRWEYQELFGYSNRDWSWSELSNGLFSIVSDDSKMFFFLIDGLDECDGDSRDLVSILFEIASNRKNVKLCVSSRPWLVFEDAFRSRPSLQMQDLTFGDIRQFSSDRLRENVMFLQLQEINEEQADFFIEQVTQRASGVFLWVALVVQSLLEGLQDGDTIKDLQARMFQIPEDLGELFEKMLRELQPGYLEQASRILQTVRASYLPWSELSMETSNLKKQDGKTTVITDDSASPLGLLTLSFMEDSNGIMIRASNGPMAVGELNFRAEQTRRRLQSRCKGLLEVPNYKNHGPYARVQFLHRTVKDFLEENRGRYFLASTTHGFDPHVTLCASFLLHANAIHPQEDDILSIERFGYLLKQFLIQCHWLEKMRNPQYVPFLVEMDRFTRAVLPDTRTPTAQASEPPLPHWTKRIDYYVGNHYQVNSLLDYAKVRSLDSTPTVPHRNRRECDNSRKKQAAWDERQTQSDRNSPLGQGESGGDSWTTEAS
ncbi:hypothetical protein O1611_g745 [Lasiodiplodia mahajangana]|uniref:Uncharacterized protein n=1 Tax=Lasiodiplodia mahajangana TaxID=1108764 RepID=A0ACC2JZH1_9PEZI|nr:hypothetical protein O1611_g745 [Lasiodiplodia mahajangana]